MTAWPPNWLTDLMTDQCPQCGAPAIWALPSTPRGKRFWLDPEPVVDGVLVIDEIRLAGTSMETVYTRRVRPKTEHPDRLRYRYHFCGGVR